jgi:hypothetical protein
MTDDLSREDRLIHRTIDGSAGVGDWAELELLARHDSAVWKRLAVAMRGELTLRRAGAAIDGYLPELPLDRRSRGNRASILIGGLGWAAALLVAFLWVGASSLGLGPSRGEPQFSLGADAAYAQYLEAGDAEGRIVQELPPLMLDATPSLDGSFVEVLFVRRTIERAAIEEVYEVNEDDAGQLSSHPVPVRRLVSSEPL